MTFEDVSNTRVIKLFVLRLNKLERSNRTPNHLFVCKFKRNIETIRTSARFYYAGSA